MEIRVYRSFASGMRILSPLPRSGVEQSMCRISAATRTAKLHRRTDIREYPTTAVFVSILFDSSAHSACQFMGDHGLSTRSLLQVTPYLINGTGPRGQSSSSVGELKRRQIGFCGQQEVPNTSRDFQLGQERG